MQTNPLHSKNCRLQFYWPKMSKLQNKSAVLTSKQHRATLSPVRPKEKISMFDFNYKTKQDPLWGKDQSYFRRKLNEGLQYEKQYVTKSGTTSSIYDNPEIFSPDRSDFYRRERYQSARKQAVSQRKFDILNNPKMSFSGRNEDKYYSSMTREDSNGKNNCSPSPFRKTLTHLMRFQPEITSKIGAVETRDFTIPRPQLKVGKSDYIDTYSPF